MVTSTICALALDQAQKANSLSERLAEDNMQSVGGRDAGTEKKLSTLLNELKELEAWEAKAESMISWRGIMLKPWCSSNE